MKFRGGEFSTGITGNFQSELTQRITWVCGVRRAGAIPISSRRLVVKAPASEGGRYRALTI